MSIIVANCPRCASQAVTFDVNQSLWISRNYSWQNVFELFAVCRHCHRGSILIGLQDHPDSSLDEDRLSQYKSLSDIVSVVDYVSLKNETSESAPEYLPEEILSAFNEGAQCFAIGCNNAAAAMFRLCLDLATKSLLPKGEVEGLNAKIRRDLGLRLPWLFKSRLIPNDLEQLSHCIKEDGNDGVHVGSLDADDAEDIMDFTRALLSRLYTEPERVKVAAERRNARRNKPTE
jgi:Domain of unknown function (DUF4145)